MVFDAVRRSRLTGQGNAMILLTISDGKLHCRDLTDTTRWSIAIKDVVLIAEYTTKQRKDCDDYFLVFVTRESGELFYLEVTGCAGGIPEMLEKLEGCLGCTLDLSLQASTDWASRVIWPEALAGSPFYEFEVVVPEGLRDRIKSRIKGKQVAHRVAEPVLRFLSEPSPANQGLAS
jgi:hypothetical protein